MMLVLFINISPRFFLTSPEMIFKNVVLPDPFGPNIPIELEFDSKFVVILSITNSSLYAKHKFLTLINLRNLQNSQFVPFHR